MDKFLEFDKECFVNVDCVEQILPLNDGNVRALIILKTKEMIRSSWSPSEMKFLERSENKT